MAAIVQENTQKHGEEFQIIMRITTPSKGEAFETQGPLGST